MQDFNIKSFFNSYFTIFFLTFVLVTFYCNESTAQRFKGSAIFGFNLAQIDGDDLAGFSKLGLTGGVKLAYPLKKNVDANLELLYSQRGSNSGFGFGGQGDSYTDLKYLEIPIYVNIQDWFIEKGQYHKARAHMGLNYSYLFQVESSNGAISNDIDIYNRNNVGFIIGASYAFTRNLGITVRYSREFRSSLKSSRAISYFVTIRTEYTF